LTGNTGVWILGTNLERIEHTRKVKQRRRQMHGFPSQGAGVLPAAYHVAQSSDIFRYIPLSHHDNPSGIFASKLPKLFFIKP
jgi:hypothetical protein